MAELKEIEDNLQTESKKKWSQSIDKKSLGILFAVGILGVIFLAPRDKQWFLIIGLIVIFIFLMAKSNEKSGTLTEQEARHIANLWFKDLRKNSVKFRVTIPSDKWETGNAYLQPDEWNGGPWRWKVGIKVITSSSNYYYYIMEINHERSNPGVYAIYEVDKEYKGEPTIVKRLLPIEIEDVKRALGKI